jgi:hypothetical protein
MAAIRAHNYITDTNLGARSYAKLRKAFPELSNLPSLQRLRTRIQALSGVEVTHYHCCINSCCCYTGPYAQLTKCPYCDEERLKRGKPRKVYSYFHLIPRFVNLFRNANVATLLQYRHDYQKKPGTTADVFDGERYRRLCNTEVTIDGDPIGHNFFSQPTDLALGLSTDGFCPFKRRKQTCWPIIVFLYNLPPEVRTRLSHIFCVGMVPGPKAPKDIDSFLLPFVNELIQLARGVPAFDARQQRMFVLFAYLIFVFGDMPAVAKLLRLRGHNAISPCRACRIIAIRDIQSNSKTHYAPLRRPDGTEYDPFSLPSRTHEEFMRQAIQVAQSPTQAEETRRGKQFGINGVPVLTVLSSLSVPASFPHDFMHIMVNVLSALVNLWTGEYKNLDVGNRDYHVQITVWNAIGEACAASGATIPSSFGCRVPNIASERYFFIAESWLLFASFLGPVVLRQCFARQEYYDHFTQLVKQMNACMKMELTSREIDEIEHGFAQWVTDYERYA